MAVENSNAGEDSGSSELQAFEQLMTETEGVIPPGFAERIEKDLQEQLGITRRLALVYLEKPVQGNRRDHRAGS